MAKKLLTTAQQDKLIRIKDMLTLAASRAREDLKDEKAAEVMERAAKAVVAAAMEVNEVKKRVVEKRLDRFIK